MSALSGSLAGASVSLSNLTAAASTAFNNQGASRAKPSADVSVGPIGTPDHETPPRTSSTQNADLSSTDRLPELHATLGEFPKIPNGDLGNPFEDLLKNPLISETEAAENYNASEQIKEQASRIAELVDRYEDLLSQIDEFIKEKLNQFTSGPPDEQTFEVIRALAEASTSLVNALTAPENETFSADPPSTESDRAAAARESVSTFLNVLV